MGAVQYVGILRYIYVLGFVLLCTNIGVAQEYRKKEEEIK